MAQHIEKKISIQAHPSAVWSALTNNDLIKQWMAEPEINLQISADWNEGSVISMRGFHHVGFENKGVVLKVDPEKELRYSYLSSLSRLSDHPENYSIISFKLNQSGNNTEVVLVISNFPTESIFNHVNLYWSATLMILKQVVETSVVQRV
jgi:uncharacterized protein YndB with AHSA1/START domain